MKAMATALAMSTMADVYWIQSFVFCFITMPFSLIPAQK
jgi:hypothetical protein